ncbi:MAG: nucleoside hydrolase [Planctomycetes bacterium RBG_13_63_9]|nr:MAG: nucleoside hydrolase [Planctomycetes bacterium RBG_13_63_9]
MHHRDSRCFWVCLVLVLLIPGVSMAAEAQRKPVPIIFDTDMGNDIDDALALALIHALQSQGECKLLAVTLTKDNQFSAPYVDLVNTFYGRGDVPIGTVRQGVTPEASRYTEPIATAEDNGRPRYPHDLRDGRNAPEATRLLREVLAAQEDGSVVIVQVGFSTNLARLLESKPDEVSRLSGAGLVRKKVRLLSVMAGACSDDLKKTHFKEYNVVTDVPSAQKVFHDWPTPIVQSGFEVGRAIKYPARSIEEDYGYVAHHPVAEGYRAYMKMPYDRETWDLTSILYAVRPGHDYFQVSPPGRIVVQDDGFTEFHEAADGNCCYLSVTPEQIERVKRAFVKLCSRRPDGR